VNARAQAVTLIVHAVIIVCLIAGVVALAWHNKIGEQATVGILSAVLGLVGGSAGTLAVQGFAQPAPNGVKAVVNESKAPPAEPGA
jgi:uncharacterized membrane protein YeaQ/YmgE (transglycosylase-associated protein family)